MRAVPSASAPLIAASLLLAGCEPDEATQAIIEIKTDFDCSLLNDVTIDLVGDEGVSTTVASTEQCSDGTIGSLVFVPASDTTEARSAFFIVVVTAGLDRPASECEANDFAGCIVARRRMTFTPDTVNILLSNDCVSAPCSSSTTCAGGGECIPFTVP